MLARKMEMPLDAMEGYFVLMSFSGGHQEFETNEEALTKHFHHMITNGVIQEMFRATIRDTDDDLWKIHVEAHIADMEKDLSDNK